TAVAQRMHEVGIEVLFEDGDIAKATPPDQPGGFGHVELTTSGTVLQCDALLSAVGRQGTAHLLDLEAAGLAPPIRGNAILVDPVTMRCIPAHEQASLGVDEDGGASGGESIEEAAEKCCVFAAGDVAGPCTVSPGGLVSTAIAQAHQALQHAFTDEWHEVAPDWPQTFVKYPPSAMWVDPTVAFVGMPEAEAVETYGRHAVEAVTVKYNDTLKVMGRGRLAGPLGRDMLDAQVMGRGRLAGPLGRDMLDAQVMGRGRLAGPLGRDMLDAQVMGRGRLAGPLGRDMLDAQVMGRGRLAGPLGRDMLDAQVMGRGRLAGPLGRDMLDAQVMGRGPPWLALCRDMLDAQVMGRGRLAGPLGRDMLDAQVMGRGRLAGPLGRDMLDAQVMGRGRLAGPLGRDMLDAQVMGRGRLAGPLGRDMLDAQVMGRGRLAAPPCAH
ncbi:hypothetical protein CYMTET_34901, partial [Cymbomonas tetramitiformis]